MPKKRISRLSFLLVAIVLAARIVWINLQWPAATQVEVPPGEVFFMQGTSLCVTGSSIVSLPELYERYHLGEEQRAQLFLEQMLAQGWAAKVLVVTLSVANETTSKITVQAGSLMAECGPWSNGVDHDFFLLANQSTGAIEIEPTQSQEITLFYDLYDQHFTPTAWQTIDTLPFVLSLSLYPEKVLLCV